MRKVKAPGYRVLVKIKPVEKEKETLSKGGLILEIKTDKQIQREQEANTEAYVVDIGPSAFKAFDDGTPWCKVGDCVLISRYSGTLVEATDGDVYRMINDQDIQAIFPEDHESNRPLRKLEAEAAVFPEDGVK